MFCISIESFTYNQIISIVLEENVSKIDSNFKHKQFAMHAIKYLN